jgi:polynucleotide 5'-kinase involved in rRNA processing
MDSSRIRNRRNKTIKLRTMESNTINEKSNNIYFSWQEKLQKRYLEKVIMLVMPKRTHKGSMIKYILNQILKVNKWFNSNKKV